MHAAQALKADILLEHKNLVHVRVFDNVILETEDVLNIHHAKMQLFNGTKQHDLLLVAGEFSSITKEAMQLAASAEMCVAKRAQAIVITSLAQRIVANFFIRVYKPDTITRIFNSEKEARQWLTEV